MDDKAMYKGFPPEKQAEYEAWLVDRYGEPVRERIAAGKAKMGGWTQGQFDEGLAEIETIEAGLATALTDGLPVSSEPVLGLMRRHHAWVARAWPQPPNRAAYIGLGDLYQEHPDFRARYEGKAKGLTEYITAAMKLYAERELA